VGDILYNTGVYSVVESLVWQSILRDSCDAAAAGGKAVPLVVDGGANLGQHMFPASCVLAHYR
jgi:hypothetical protein